MKKTTKLILVTVLSFFILIPVGISNAITISYEATDLTDTMPGEDLWEYSYMVSDFTFNMDYGFTVFFDYMLCSDLEDPPPSMNSDWDPIVWQADLALPDDGAYDAIALVDGASLADPFTVSFVWHGSGAPGAQYFEVYDPSFNVIDSDDTAQSAPVPEPATIFLVGTGLLGLAGLKKKSKHFRI